MKLSFATIFAASAAAAVSSVSAFAPAVKTTSSSAIRMSEETTTSTSVDEEVSTPPAATPAPLGPTLNGWTPDASLPCYGLPGAIAPLGYFDPLGFCKERSLDGVKRFREAEVLHSRVAMMAVLGYLVQENTPTITYGLDVPTTIANNQIPEVSFGIMFPFFLAINISEAYRASKGK
jgi:Chlorophyll A-B binding protein